MIEVTLIASFHKKLFLESLNIRYRRLLDVGCRLGDLGGSILAEDTGGTEILLALGGLTRENMGHDDITRDLDQTACVEILESGRLLVEALDLVGSTLEGTAQSRQACRDIGHALARKSLLVAEHLLVIGALGNVVDSCHDLQLSSTLVYVHDAGIAVETLAGVVLHEARAAPKRTSWPAA